MSLDGLTPLFTVLGVVVTALGAILVGRGSDRQRRQSAEQEYELGLIDRYKDLLESTEQRLTARIVEVEAQQAKLRLELESERRARLASETQRDAAIMHAKALRGAWPDDDVPISIPYIIKEFFEI